MTECLRSPGVGCVTGFLGGDSSLFSFSDTFRLALDFLPDLTSLSKPSSAASTVLTEASSSTSLVRPLFPAFCFLRDGGVLRLSLTADPEVEDEAEADGRLLDN